MKYSIACVAAALSFAAAPASAKEEEHKPKYGGQVREVNEIQYELVTKPGVVTVFVEDHGKKLDTKGATGKVTLRQGADRSEVALVPAGDNKLEGKGTFKSAPGTTAILQVTRAGKAEESVRFTLK